MGRSNSIKLGQPLSFGLTFGWLPTNLAFSDIRHEFEEHFKRA
jgi:hypothetical protein